MSADDVQLLQDAVDTNMISDEAEDTSNHFNDYGNEDEEYEDDEHEAEKVHKLRIHNGKVSYSRKIGNNLVKIEAYTSPCNAYSRIRDPYTGAILPDKVGSRDENHYYKVKMPCIGTGDQPIIFYYSTPEAFERHHLVKLPRELVNDWRRKHAMDELGEEDEESNDGFITVK
jgi:hypothetical protein